MKSVITVTKFGSVGVNRAMTSTTGPRTLPSVRVSRPALSVIFRIGGDPFTKERNSFIASHRVHTHLVGRVRAGITLHIRRARASSTFLISNQKRLRLSILVRAVEQRKFRLRMSGPRIVCGAVGNGHYRPLRELAIRIPRRFVKTIVRKLNPHHTRVVSVRRLTKCVGVSFSVPTHKLLKFEGRLLAAAHNANVVCRMFRKCTPCGKSVPREAENSLITFRTNAAATCNLGSVLSEKRLFLNPNIRICRNVVINRGTHRRSVSIGPYGGGRLAGAHTSNSSSTVGLPPYHLFALRSTLR